MAFTLYNYQRVFLLRILEQLRRKASTPLPGTLFCGRERLAGSLLRAAADFATDAAADVATEDSTAAFAFAFAATAAALALSRLRCLGLRSSVPYSIASQRQCTRSAAGFTQRKDRLPLFQQVFIQNALASGSVSAIRAEVGFIPRLLMLVADTCCCSNQIRQGHDTPKSHGH